MCGYALVSLSLIKCPNLSQNTLIAIGQSCPHLLEATFRDVDGLFSDTRSKEMSEPASQADTLEAIANFASGCQRLHTLHLSMDIPNLHLNAFEPFRSHPSLRTLVLSSCKHLTAFYLSPFTSLHKLVISGCPAMSADLPLASMPALRHLSYLGMGLTVKCLWTLWQTATYLKRVILDAIGQCYDSPSCSYVCTSAPSSSCDPGNEEDLPNALRSFESYNLLSTSLPSWALAYLLSFSPESLESFSLHGTLHEPNLAFGAKDSLSRFGTPASYVMKLVDLDQYGHNLNMLFPHRLSWWYRALMFMSRVKGSRLSQQREAQFWPDLPLPVTATIGTITPLCPSDGQTRNGTVNRLPALIRSKSSKQVSLALDNPSRPASAVISTSFLSPFGTSETRKKHTIIPEPSQDLIDLLSLPSSSTEKDGLSTPCKRLTRDQRQWLHRVTGDRLIRLEV